MTEGSPWKLILLFAIPVLLGNIFQQFYNMADTMMVGQLLGMRALAAMGASGSLTALYIGLVTGVALGVSIRISKEYGAGDERGMKMAIAGCIRLCTWICIVIIVLALISKRWLLEILQTPQSIMAMSDTYITIVVIGLVATMAYNAMASMLRAIGDSRTPLYFLIIASLVNVGLDYVFMKYLAMGVEGAAIATVISQALSAVLCYFYMMKKYTIFHLKKAEFQVDRDMLMNQFSMAISMGLMNSIVSIGSVVLQFAVNGLGEMIIAAHTAARKVVEMFMQPLVSIAIADTTFVSQNLGAKKYARIRDGLKKSMLLNMIWVGIVILISYTCVDVLFQLLVKASEVEVIETASYYCRVTSPFYLVLSVLFIYRNALQGMGNGRIPVLSSCIEMLVKIVVTFLLIPFTAYTGVALSEPIAWSLMAPFLVIFFYRDLKVRETQVQ